MSEPRIIWHDEWHDGETPELIAFNAFIHLERMNESTWWMGISAGDEYVAVRIFAKSSRSQVIGRVDDESDTPIVRDLSGGGYSRSLNYWRRPHAVRPAPAPSGAGSVQPGPAQVDY